jgi:hypothetical protein
MSGPLSQDEAIVVLVSATNGFAAFGFTALLTMEQRERLGRAMLATRSVAEDPDRYNPATLPHNVTIEHFINGIEKLSKIAHGMQL